MTKKRDYLSLKFVEITAHKNSIQNVLKKTIWEVKDGSFKRICR